MPTKAAVIGAMLAALCACGGPESRQAGNDDDAAPASAPPASPANAWNAADACALIGAPVVAEAAGAEVKGTQLTGVTAGQQGLATVSTCLYTLANNGTVSLLTRQSPVDDFTPQAVEQARIGGGMMPAAEDVPGLGRAALWNKKMNNLQLFIDDNRYATITVFGAPRGKDPKAIATAIAQKLL